MENFTEAIAILHEHSENGLVNWQLAIDSKSSVVPVVPHSARDEI